MKYFFNSCGHESDEPRNMGKGAARAKRLAEYFDRPCRDCAIARINASVNSLTDRHANPLPYDIKREHAINRIAKLHY
jgi:hypothetical protein